MSDLLSEKEDKVMKALENIYFHAHKNSIPAEFAAIVAKAIHDAYMENNNK